METRTAPAELTCVADLPSDGCIVVRRWDRKRARGFWVTKVAEHADPADEVVTLTVVPMSITDGTATGEPRKIVVAFGMDSVTAMP